MVHRIILHDTRVLQQVFTTYSTYRSYMLVVDDELIELKGASLSLTKKFTDYSSKLVAINYF